jgi:hypothetical protein
MNWNICLGVLLALLIYPTYRSLDGTVFTSADAKGIVFFDRENVQIQSEVTIDDAIKGAGFSVIGDGTRRDMTRRLDDASEIKTTYDAFGNKTEVRIFFNNPRLRQIVLRTSVDGQRQVYIYGPNGEVEAVPSARLDEVLNAPANEVAGFAGITSVKGTKRMRSMFPTITLLPGQQTYQNPVQMQQPALATQEDSQAKTTDTVGETTTPPNKNLVPKQNNEIQKPNLDFKQ